MPLGMLLLCEQETCGNNKSGRMIELCSRKWVKSHLFLLFINIIQARNMSDLHHGLSASHWWEEQATLPDWWVPEKLNPYNFYVPPLSRNLTIHRNLTLQAQEEGHAHPASFLLTTLLISQSSLIRLVSFCQSLKKREREIGLGVVYSSQPFPVPALVSPLE